MTQTSLALRSDRVPFARPRAVRLHAVRMTSAGPLHAARSAALRITAGIAGVSAATAGVLLAAGNTTDLPKWLVVVTGVTLTPSLLFLADLSREDKTRATVTARDRSRDIATRDNAITASSQGVSPLNRGPRRRALTR